MHFIAPACHGSLQAARIAATAYPGGVSPSPCRFVGRRDELALLCQAAEAARGGQPQVILVRGEPGIGKTTLVTRVAAEIRSTGGTTVWGRASELGGAPAHWPLVQILEGLGDAGSLAMLERLEQPTSESPTTRFRLHAGLARTLRERARSLDVMCLLLEDLHAADTDTLRALLVLLSALQAEPIYLLCTARTVDTGADEETATLLDEVARRCLVVELGGLTRDDVLQLVAARVDGARAGAAADDLLARTSGNPLFVTSLLASHGDDLPRTVRAALQSRFARLDPLHREVLTNAAAVGTDWSFSTLVELTRRDDAVVAAAVAAAIDESTSPTSAVAAIDSCTR